MQKPANVTRQERLIPQWKPLKLFNLYRIALGMLFFVLSTFEGPQFLREYYPLAFTLLTVFYVLFALFWIIPNRKGWPAFHIQVFIQTIVDILFVTLAMHFSGGVTNGLGMLMIVAIAGASLLLPGRTALLFAALGALALLIEQFYAHWRGIVETTAYSQTGMLGASLFATAILAVSLSRRATLSEELAERRGIDLANLEELNRYIVNRMSSGIIVVDDEGCIRLMNKSACSLLGQPVVEDFGSLKELSYPLYRLYGEWQAILNRRRSDQLLSQTSIPGLQVRVTHIGSRKEDRGTVIFLENSADITRRIQESKLASLGRLTASIAHEIRNPLGAISHAVQLLGESEDLDKGDSRLVHIIHDQSRRMNEIIQNILRLSRKELPKQEIIALSPWLKRFVEEFSRIQGVAKDWASISLSPEDTSVFFDQNHLHQLLWNLCVNAKKYGALPDNPFKVDLVGGLSPGSSAPVLEVIDHGSGIEPAVQEQLFEPFFTTSTTGTGLGLYISRELCEKNGGNLSYFPSPLGGSCFRIQFPIYHPEEHVSAAGAYRR
jgi:two-component system sensor histidine kinase PilS (NtrC family)